ncbi:MAG: hypothetical protein SHS37scaffold145_67 [Phage 71_18]|nr:MAG: hypothetical protein SHS37scaffold145_67 [Phage 71_18]
MIDRTPRLWVVNDRLSIDLDDVLAIRLTEPVLMQNHAWTVQALMVPAGWREATVPMAPAWVHLARFDSGVGISATEPRLAARTFYEAALHHWRRHQVLVA